MIKTPMKQKILDPDKVQCNTYTLVINSVKKFHKRKVSDQHLLINPLEFHLNGLLHGLEQGSATCSPQVACGPCNLYM
jgi:hypothetical protein